MKHIKIKSKVNGHLISFIKKVIWTLYFKLDVQEEFKALLLKSTEM